MVALASVLCFAPVVSQAAEWTTSSFKQVMNGRDTQKLTGIHGKYGYATSITFSLSNENAIYELSQKTITSKLEERGSGYCIHIKGSKYCDNGRIGWRCVDLIEKSNTSSGTVFRFKRRNKTLYHDMSWGN